MTPNEILIQSLYGRPANPDLVDAVPGEIPFRSPRWGRALTFAVMAFFVWLASVALIAFVPVVFLVPYMVSTGTPLGDSETVTEFIRTDPMAIIISLAAVIPAHLLTLLLTWVVITKGRQYSFRGTLGWQTGGFRWWHYCVTVGGFLLVLIVVSNFFPQQDHELLRILRSSRNAVYLAAFMATLTAPIVEEVIYRGIVYTSIQRAAGIPLAFIFTTLLFTAVHVPQYYESVSTLVLLTLLSVILTAVRVKTGNLLPCIILHTLFNGIQSVFLILEPLFPKQENTEIVGAVLHLLK